MCLLPRGSCRMAALGEPVALTVLEGQDTTILLCSTCYPVLVSSHFSPNTKEFKQQLCNESGKVIHSRRTDSPSDCAVSEVGESETALRPSES